MSTEAERRADALARIPVRNAWHMLLYAWDLAAWSGGVRREVESSQSLLGLLAVVLEDCTRRLMRRQLARAHVPCHRTVQGIRGRVDLSASLKQMTFQAGRAVCSFSELGLNTPRNRILRSTLHALSRDPRVEHKDPKRRAVLQRRLAELQGEMEEVPLVRVDVSDFRRLQLGRNDRDYALPLAVCEFVHRLEMPMEFEGDHAMVALCRHEIKFERLFEAFVRNFYRYHLTGHTVSSQRLDWFDELDCELAPEMRTDITIVENAPPHRRLVIDTKFSKTTLAETWHGGERLKSANLYQLYTYLRTQEDQSAAHRHAKGMLLYPLTTTAVDTAMMVQGHRIRVATIDLAQEWSEIERGLLRLIEVTSSVRRE